MKKIKEVILSWLANFFTGALFLIGKVFPIKIGVPYYQRAHLLVNTEYWLRENRACLKGFCFFVSGSKPWNRQVLQMIKRKVFVLENDIIYRLFRAFQQRRPESNIWIDLSDSGHYHPVEWSSAPQQLVLNEQEQQKGKLLLKEMGIEEKEPVVCFFARDDRYLDETIGRWGWEYHRYRNNNIENYLKAMEWLTANNGYWALRMGALVERRLTINNPRIIDYASTCRTDFMDIFLPSCCRFVVGDTSGPITIPIVFNIPTVEVNIVPLAHVARNRNSLFIPKKYRDIRTGRILTFREIFDKKMDNWGMSKDYEQAGIEVLENSPEEIMDVVMEMHLRLEGKWQQTSEDECLQDKFRACIPEGHRIKGFVSRIGAAFLRNNRDLLE